MDPELVEGPIKIRHAGLFLNEDLSVGCIHFRTLSLSKGQSVSCESGLFFNEDLSVGCLFFLRYYNFFARSWAAWPRPPVLIWSLLVVYFTILLLLNLKFAHSIIIIL